LSKATHVLLRDLIAERRPDVDAVEAIEDARVLVDGAVVTNPRSRVRADCSIVVLEPSELRGSVKLRAALDAFAVDVTGRVALDVGAAAGGFTTVLLERGAARVYAVDAGHGQLVGSLRQDPRVVNLEAVNVGDLDRDRIPEVVEVVVVDVSYLSLSEAVRQLSPLDIGPGADLIGLVKPMFELRLPSAPTDRPALDRALAAAVDGVRACGFRVVATMDSPVEGAGGARELLLHGHRLVL